jgi:hypothetical protein
MMNPKPFSAAFELSLKVLSLANLLPLKQVTSDIRRTPKFRCIAKSIKEVGLVEPLVVYRKPDVRGRHLLLDGHLRWAVMKELGHVTADCLLAKDDEAFTYNKRVNRLSIVQEHFMILRAIERGVPEAKLAKALGVKIAFIRQRRSLLNGICSEAVNLLSDKSVNPVTFNSIRKMKPRRQIEACELMVAAANYSASYAKALLAGTKECDCVKPARPAIPAVVTSADLALMERELKSAQRELATTEAAYGMEMLDLVMATRYVSLLISNAHIKRYLDDNHPEILKEFVAITYGASLNTATSLEEPLARRNFE